MSLEILLLILRLVAAALLYAFLGSLLYMLWRDATSAAEGHPRESISVARLVVVEGDPSLPTGTDYVLGKTTSLGRASTSTVVIPNSFASVEHARIQYRDGCWWLEDRGSRNGTLVNDIPVVDALVLSTGDMIGIGGIRFRVEIDQPTSKG